MSKLEWKRHAGDCSTASYKLFSLEVVWERGYYVRIQGNRIEAIGVSDSMQNAQKSAEYWVLNQCKAFVKLLESDKDSTDA